MREDKDKASAAALRKAVFEALISLLLMVIALSPVFAWQAASSVLAAYAPVSAPQSFYIGAGHIEFEGEEYYNQTAAINQFEDIRYLYLTGIDVTSGNTYYDYVFCVYGKAVPSFKLQLAYTTNNQFTYAIYNATESNVSGDVAYTTHTSTGESSGSTYYYSISGEAIAGHFLNGKTENGKLLGEDAADEAEYAEANKFHKKTYGTYNNVDKYAEPLYWQTTNAITGSHRDTFVKYFILRVWINGKPSNDRETDIVCIAAKSLS